MAKTETLLEELDGLSLMVEEITKPAAPKEPDPEPVVEQSADLEAIAQRIKEQLPAIEEILATAEKTAPLKRFVWLAWGAIQSLVSNLDGIADEVKKKGAEVGKDTAAAVAAVEDLKKALQPVQDAVDHLNSISKVNA